MIALLEPLESRIASASVFAFTDVDGDPVKIISTTGDLNAASVATRIAAGSGERTKMYEGTRQ